MNVVGHDSTVTSLSYAQDVFQGYKRLYWATYLFKNLAGQTISGERRDPSHTNLQLVAREKAINKWQDFIWDKVIVPFADLFRYDYWNIADGDDESCGGSSFYFIYYSCC